MGRIRKFISFYALLIMFFLKHDFKNVFKVIVDY